MNVDSQGKCRGSCNRCTCNGFIKQCSSVKCGHAPILNSHMLVDLTTEAASSQFVHHVKDITFPKTSDVKNAVSSHEDIGNHLILDLIVTIMVKAAG